MTVTVFGIPNCDTVKKARQWLTERGLTHAFHDFKKSGVPAELEQWCEALGTDTLINRKGSTWRQLPGDLQAQAATPAGAKALMQAHPSLIKRPVVGWSQGGTIQWTLGFNADVWAELAQSCTAD